jgi:hypothetical protein
MWDLELLLSGHLLNPGAWSIHPADANELPSSHLPTEGRAGPRPPNSGGFAAPVFRDRAAASGLQLIKAAILCTSDKPKVYHMLDEPRADLDPGRYNYR